MDFRLKTFAAETRLVLHYMGEEYVTTRLEHDDDSGERHRREVGTDTAHKGHQMRKGLDRQAKELRSLIGTIERRH